MLRNIDRSNWFVLIPAGLILFLLASCVSRDRMGRSELTDYDTEASPTFLFTILSPETVAKESSTFFSAGTLLLADRIFSPPVSIVETEGNETGFSLQGSSLTRFEGEAVCDDGECTFSVSLQGQDCPQAKLSMGQEYIINCDGLGGIHLYELTLETGSVTRRPIPGFEFSYLGHPSLLEKQVLIYVAREEPIVFDLDPALASDENFTRNLTAAVNYWNRMIGFQALDFRVTPAAETAFKVFGSVIVKLPGSGLARGISYADPRSGKIFSGKMDVYEGLLSQPEEVQKWALAHELGHVLGLGHNFSASQDKIHSGDAYATSVMDYQDKVSIDVELPYDKAAMDWVYRGNRSQVVFKACNDRESLYTIGCDKADLASPSKDLAIGLKGALDFNPHLLRSFFDVSSFEERFRAIVEQKEAGKDEWGIQFLEMLEQDMGSSFLIGYKEAAFSSDEDLSRDTKAAWASLFNAARTHSEADLTPLEADFLLFVEQVFQSPPVNATNLSQYISAYNVWITRR